MHCPSIELCRRSRFSRRPFVPRTPCLLPLPRPGRRVATCRFFDQVDALYGIPAHCTYPVERHLRVSGSFMSIDSSRRILVGSSMCFFGFVLFAFLSRRHACTGRTGFSTCSTAVTENLIHLALRTFDFASHRWHRCGRGGQWEVALALLNETRKYGPSATASVYVATAQACARAGKWEEATDLMEVRTLG